VEPARSEMVGPNFRATAEHPAGSKGKKQLRRVGPGDGKSSQTNFFGPVLSGPGREGGDGKAR